MSKRLFGFFSGSLKDFFLYPEVQAWIRKISGVSSGESSVDSINGKTGLVTLTKSDLGLGSVNNTSDVNKPISTATQTALDNKQDKLSLGTNFIPKAISSSEVGNSNISDNGGWIGIGTDDPQAALDISSTVAGVLIPRMTSAQINAIATPIQGEEVYNLSTGNKEVYNGINWTGRVIVDAGNTLSLAYGQDYIFTGSTATWTLPVVLSTLFGRGNMITIKNRGTGNLTVNSNTGNTIYVSAVTNTLVIAAGNAVILMPDGTYFNVE